VESDYTAKVAGYPTAIAVDASGGAFVAGSAVSQADVSSSFLARLAPDGSAGFYSTLPAAIFGIVVRRGSRRGMPSFTEAPGMKVESCSASIPPARSHFRGPAPKAFFPHSRWMRLGTCTVTGSTQYLTPVRNSLATCGLDLLSVFTPDGFGTPNHDIPGGHNSGALVAIGVNSNVFVVDRAEVGFTPSQTGPFPSVPPANPGDATTPVPVAPLPQCQRATFPLACLGNAATYTGSSVAPGMMVSLFGNGLGPQQGIQTQAHPAESFPTQAGNVEVTFDGNPVPLTWVQDAQINAVAPWSLTPGPNHAGLRFVPEHEDELPDCAVAQTSPGVFTIDGVHAAALNQDGTINSADHPAPVGSIISVWATGLGPIDPAQEMVRWWGFRCPQIQRRSPFRQFK